ncbi:MAG: DUF2721 domain-containing protein [Brachymonas sp.]|nr:DUF2721 domain-containing protein [Brachymonas sp.]
MQLADLIPTLQLAIGPVILISGVGSILLSMTNRYGRVIDRSRHVMQALKHTDGHERHVLLQQIHVLTKRARIVRRGIALGVSSVFMASVFIITLFVSALSGLQIAPLIVAEFVLCMLCLMGCLAMYMADINLSLRALWMEVPADVRHQAEQTSPGA